jgi:hypothetical protein
MPFRTANIITVIYYEDLGFIASSPTLQLHVVMPLGARRFPSCITRWHDLDDEKFWEQVIACFSLIRHIFVAQATYLSSRA